MNIDLREGLLEALDMGDGMGTLQALDYEGVGFNPLHKLSANELLKQKINNRESIKHKTYIHNIFPRIPKLGLLA